MSTDEVSLSASFLSMAPTEDMQGMSEEPLLGPTRSRNSCRPTKRTDCLLATMAAVLLVGIVIGSFGTSLVHLKGCKAADSTNSSGSNATVDESLNVVTEEDEPYVTISRETDPVQNNTGDDMPSTTTKWPVTIGNKGSKIKAPAPANDDAKDILLVFNDDHFTATRYGWMAHWVVDNSTGDQLLSEKVPYDIQKDGRGVVIRDSGLYQANAQLCFESRPGYIYEFEIRRQPSKGDPRVLKTCRVKSSPGPDLYSGLSCKTSASSFLDVGDEVNVHVNGAGRRISAECKSAFKITKLSS